MPHLRRIALQEVPARGDIEEEIFHGDAGAGGCSDRLLPGHAAILDLDTRTRFIFGPPGPQLDLGHSGDRRERFTTKSHRTDMEQVVDIPDLGSGMPFERHAGIRFAHAFPVVDDLDQRLPRVLDEQADIVGP